MKHIFYRYVTLLLMGCTLASPALGEGVKGITRRIEAPESVSLPAVTPGSHSTLAFEAKVYVADVDRVPILQVKIDDIPEETIFAAADALNLKDINRDPSAWKVDLFEDGNNTKGYTGYSSGWRQFNAYISRNCEEQPEAVTHSNLYSDEFKKADYFLGQLEAVPYPDAEREGTMTRDTAYALAVQTIATFSQGYAYALEVDGALGGYAQLTDAEITAINRGKKDAASIPKLPYAFSFHFAPVFEGIPVTQSDNPWPWLSKVDAESFACTKDPDRKGIRFIAPNLVDSRLQVVVLDEGVHGLAWKNPLSVTGVLQEDAKLLPFAEILDKGMDELQRHCILSEEGYEQHRVSCDIVVNEIRFGYACRQMEPGSMDLRLVPVWDFIVNENLIRDGQWERLDNNYGQSVVTLSAEDGSVLYRHVGEVY